MKQTVQELSGETTTGSTGVSNIQGKVWLDSILEAAKNKMYFEQFAYVVNVPAGNKDLAVPIATTNKSFTSFTTQATARTMTEIDNLTAVTFTPVTVKFGVRISKDVVRTSQVNVVEFARNQMAYDAALYVDTACATAIAAATPAATLYGGDATTTGTLETGDVLTTDLVAKAQRYLKSSGWVSEPDRPFVLFVPAVAEEAFFKDSQFTNAAEYGSDKVVANGEIGSYLGVRVVVTEQCPSASNWGSGSLTGHTCFLLKAKVAYGIAYGEKPTLQSEYKMNEAAYDVYLDMALHADSLQDGAIVLIKVSDA
jgi:N4-gp56 family major capsid protein